MSLTFYRDQLPSRQSRSFYDCMAEQTRRGNLTGTYTMQALNQEQALDDALAAASALRMDRPDFFHLGWEHKAELDRQGQLQVSNEVLFTPEQIRRTRPAMRRKLDELVRGTESLPVWERERAIYERIVKCIRYDRQEGDAFLDHTAVGPLLRGSGVCDGFSCMTALAMRRAGIPCIRVVGTGREERHSWNMVWVDGKSYHLDVTWEQRVLGRVAYHYFNLSDGEIRADHCPDGKYALPPCTDEDGGYFAVTHNICDTALDGVRRVSGLLREGARDVWIKLRQGDVEDCVQKALQCAGPVVCLHSRDPLRRSALLCRAEPEIEVI